MWWHRDDTTGARRRSPRDTAPDGDALELVGIGAHERDALYQFETADGTDVSLHDLDCTGIDVRPLDQSITLSFADDSGPAPALVMCFEGARIVRWRRDQPLAPARHAGQVRDLAWDNRRELELHLVDDAIAFTATRLTVTTRGLPAPR